MKYTAEHLDFLRVGYATKPLRYLVQSFNEKFSMTATCAQINSVLNRYRILSGRTRRFEKGNIPWNAGVKGSLKANVTSFKQGNIPATRKPLGSERICSKDGYIYVKIAERNPHTGSPTRYKCKHVHVWEQKNGKVPPGMVVAFKDGDILNCDPDNLMLISRAELLRLNQHGYKEMPDKLKPSLLALTKLEVKIFKRKHECNNSGKRSV